MVLRNKDLAGLARDPFNLRPPVQIDTGASAEISACGTYRYMLERWWGPKNYPPCVFIMLNPSTADGEKDDPTIRKCIAYAKRWNYFRIIVLNLFAYRATDPTRLSKCQDPVGPRNEATVLDIARFTPGIIVCAWGLIRSERLVLHERRMRRLLRETDRDFRVLKTNKDGSPSHPLYLKSKLDPEVWLP